jgi:galactokinase/mevalonate kinase-like predicted kinase
MTKRSRRVVKLEEDRVKELKELENLKDTNIENIKKIIINQRKLYDEFISNTKEHNLVIEKVTEKLSTDVLHNDINHFQGILRNRYYSCFDLLNSYSDKIKNLQKEHYILLDNIAVTNDNIKKLNFIYSNK